MALKLRTFSNIEQRITDLLTSWGSWAKPDYSDGPIGGGRAVTVLEVLAHATHAQSYLQIAQSIANDPAFATASAEHQQDVKDFIAEMQSAVNEFADATDHEKVWASLPADRRKLAVQHVQVDRTIVAALNARVQGKGPKGGAPAAPPSNSP